MNLLRNVLIGVLLGIAVIAAVVASGREPAAAPTIVEILV